jgi:hypothetical protein
LKENKMSKTKEGKSARNKEGKRISKLSKFKMGERRTTSTDNDQFVLSEKLGLWHYCLHKSGKRQVNGPKIKENQRRAWREVRDRSIIGKRKEEGEIKNPIIGNPP